MCHSHAGKVETVEASQTKAALGSHQTRGRYRFVQNPSDLRSRQRVDVSLPMIAPRGYEGGDEPTLILIFGWLSAKPGPLRKYSDAYREIYPTSTQIIVQADTLRYWKHDSARERAVLPAVQKLEELINREPQNPPRILIQAMSGGGVMSLVDFANALHRRSFVAPAGSKCAFLFDSCPSPPTLPLVFRSFTAGVRNRLALCLVGLAIVVLYVLLYLWHALSLRPEALAHAIARLDDPRLLPWTSARTPRMYLYSSGDKVVSARAVEAHAKEARKAGFPVQMVNFGKSGHVTHAKDHPEKYWNAVRSFWSEALRQ